LCWAASKRRHTCLLHLHHNRLIHATPLTGRVLNTPHKTHILSTNLNPIAHPCLLGLSQVQLCCNQENGAILKLTEESLISVTHEDASTLDVKAMSSLTFTSMSLSDRPRAGGCWIEDAIKGPTGGQKQTHFMSETSKLQKKKNITYSKWPTESLCITESTFTPHVVHYFTQETC